MKQKLLCLITVLSLLFFCYIYYSGRPVYELAATPQAIAISSYNQGSHVFPDPSQTQYMMDLFLDNGSRTLYGTSHISTANNTTIPLQELWFTVYPQAFVHAQGSPAPNSSYYAGFNPGGIDILRLSVNGVELEGTIDGISLKIDLPREIPRLETVDIELAWQVKIPRLAYRFGYNEGVYMLGNFYPALNVFTGEEWLISYNSPFGDPFCLSSADYQVKINIPESMSLVSTGTIKEIIAEDTGRQVVVTEAKNVRDFCLTVMYDYKKVSLNKNNTLVEIYAPAKKADEINKIAQQAEDILNFYACSWGSYPYSEFKAVFVPMQGFYGMEYSGMIFLRDEFLDGIYDQARFDFIMAHEIAHQWWHGLVGNDQLKEAWLDEGLANWSAYRYLQTYKNKTPPAVNPNAKANLTLALGDIHSSQEYYLIAYSGGEAFWFGLEQELGTATVNNILRRYLANYRFKIATRQDLMAIIDLEADRDMSSFFDRWSLPAQ